MTVAHTATMKGPVQSSAAGGTGNGSQGKMTIAEPNSGDCSRGERRKARMAAKTAAIDSGSSHHGARRATRALVDGAPIRPIVPSEHQMATPAQTAAGNPFK